MSFWRPGSDRGPPLSTSSSTSSSSSSSSIYIPPNNKHSHLSIAQQRQLLPIVKLKEQILWALETKQVVIVVGETGSGKLNVYLSDCIDR